MLERDDNLKWFVWMSTELVVNKQGKTKIWHFFKKFDAIAAFEKKFE